MFLFFLPSRLRHFPQIQQSYLININIPILFSENISQFVFFIIIIWIIFLVIPCFTLLSILSSLFMCDKIWWLKRERESLGAFHGFAEISPYSSSILFDFTRLSPFYSHRRWYCSSRQFSSEETRLRKRLRFGTNLSTHFFFFLLVLWLILERKIKKKSNEFYCFPLSVFIRSDEFNNFQVKAQTFLVYCWACCSWSKLWNLRFLVLLTSILFNF